MDFRIESLKLYVDWSKWLAAIDTAVIAGLFVLLSDPTKLSGTWPTVAVCVTMAFLLISLWGSGQLLFCIPGIVKDLRDTTATDVDLMHNCQFRFNLRTYQRIQYVSLYPAAAALILLVCLVAFKKVG